MSGYMRREQSFKMRMTMLWRVLKVGFRNLFRNAWLSVAAIAVMVVALTIMLLAVVLNVAARDVIGELSQDLKVSVYIQEDATEDERQELENALKSNEHVASVDYVTKEEAQNRFVKSFKDDEQLLSGLLLAGADVLPASYEVSTTDLSKMPQIGDIALQEKFEKTVESVTLGKTDARATIDRAADIQNFVTISSVVAAAVFTVVSVLIIFNTIRMALFTRSEEIRIMKLIGATPGYIRGPFLVEASLYGVIAGIVAAGAVYSIIGSVGSKIASQPEFAGTYEYFTQVSTIAYMFMGAILGGILVGLFSSTLALKRYLRLKHW